MIETGLAFLVFMAPLAFLGLLMAATGGITGMRRRPPSPAPIEIGPRSWGNEHGRPVLASDAERDETLAWIAEAVGEGRLTFEEAERRIDGVLHSRHRHELDELAGDLPRVARSTRDARRTPTPHLGVLGVAAGSVLAALVVQAISGVWELWLVAVAACGLWAARGTR